jgi:hypothetical protein
VEDGGSIPSWPTMIFSLTVGLRHCVYETRMESSTLSGATCDLLVAELHNILMDLRRSGHRVACCAAKASQVRVLPDRLQNSLRCVVGVTVALLPSKQ